MDTASLLANLVGFVLFPLWLLAGLGDWLCHRRSHIERTSGAGESWFHVALHALIAVPAVLVLFFEPGALLLAIAAVAVVAHTLLAWWDTAYSQPKRYISPIEQLIHSFLDLLPAFALAIGFVLAWPALEAPAWSLVRRAEPLSTGWIAAVLVGFALGLAFILEELARGRRAAAGLSAAPPSAAGPSRPRP